MSDPILQKEIAAYNRELPVLLGKSGKFVLIKGESVVGVYDSYEDALSIGYERFGLEAFLVKRIAPTEQVSFFTRDFSSACPA